MRKSGIIISNDVEANFREISMGNIAPNTLYRSSHPIKNDKQEQVISILASSARIATIINLSDFDTEIKRKAFFAPWYDKLLKNNRVIALGTDFSQTSEYFQKNLRKACNLSSIPKAPGLFIATPE
jgi:hypothetical protein